MKWWDLSTHAMSLQEIYERENQSKRQDTDSRCKLLIQVNVLVNYRVNET